MASFYFHVLHCQADLSMERSTFVCIAQVSRHQQTVCESHSVRFVSLSVYCFVEGGGTFHVGKPDLIFETFLKVKFL